MTDWAIALAFLLGGVLVDRIIVSWQQKLSDSSERRRMRRDVLRKLAGHRYLLTKHFKGMDGMIWVALNEIAIAYLDDETVMEELSKFQDNVDNGFESSLFPLMQAMAESAELPAKELRRCLIKKPFVPRQKESTPAANDDSPKP